MMKRVAIWSIPVLLLVAATDAIARDHTPVLADKGTVMAQDPYANGSALTTGRIEGFRKLYVAETAVDGLKPAKGVTAGLPPVGDLAVVNPTSAWTDVTVNGQLIGRLGPFREGHIHDVQSGVYEIGFTLPNGRVWSDQAATTVLEKAPVSEG
jgi:hypothetical protein